MQIPHGSTLDADFMFTKLIVRDLEGAARFYTSVFGLIEMQRVDAVIEGRAAKEVVYMPTMQGGPMFILLHYLDQASASAGESVLGFAASDVDACLARVEQFGGTVVDAPKDLPEGMLRYAFVRDPEGHLVQISARMG